MSGSDILLIGAGGHAQACIEVIEHRGGLRILGLVGSIQEIGKMVLGYPVIGTDADLPLQRLLCGYVLVGVGQLRPSNTRKCLFDRLRAIGFEMPTIIAADAIVSRHAVIGAGTIVMHGAIVNAGAHVGENCILNSRCLVEHGAVIGDHCHISTGAIVNGDASVGAGSTVGSGSVVREGLSIGADCLVGMGLTVRRNLRDGDTYKGILNKDGK
jgi:sugar O-acyltransferase (sialic acid O-acetyltransferase NeuD family)